MRLKKKTFQHMFWAVSQLDYAAFHGDGECLEAAVENARMALMVLGELTAEQEAEQEEEDDHE